MTITCTIEELKQVYEPIYKHMKGVFSLLKQGGISLYFAYNESPNILMEAIKILKSTEALN